MTEGRTRRKGATEQRRRSAGTKVKAVKYEFSNPWPYMSDPEAMVKQVLNGLEVPYSWRLFDGESPTVKLVIPDFAPEFTLREYKSVIIVLGGFFGTLPGVLDRTSLAEVALEQDGWKVAILYEADIRKNPFLAVTNALPELKAAAIKGTERRNPTAETLMGQTMEKRRAQLRALALHRSLFHLKVHTGTGRSRRGSDNRAGRRRARRGDSRRQGAPAPNPRT